MSNSYPVNTGSSVIGLCFDDGVVIAADTLVSYGKMARFFDCSRLYKVNQTTIAGCGGDYADYQFLHNLIEQKQIDREANEQGVDLSPRALHSWLTRVQYNRRSKFEPLWTSWVVGGIDEGKPFLGFVDKLGTAYKDSIIATGFGTYMAVPVMRKFYDDKNGRITRDEAIGLMKKCIGLLFARDCSAHNMYEIAVVDANGAEILGPLRATHDWSNVKEHRTS
ncbi:proteasome subunit beta type-4 [Tetranychus urticae]|uniref:Proteasome subunit beta n=1 Tax=Tetranychus urticae TaxID=32264 RepID=T1JWK0_TETUR|nr:proteasome subunit beta type-4 [Tetranychus urticae]